MTTHKLNIFDTLNIIQRKSQNGFNCLTEEQQKGFQPLVIMRWLSGTTNPRQVFFLNELVNPFVFNFSKDKLLLYYLMTTCTAGKSQKVKWIKKKSVSNTKQLITLQIIREVFNYNETKAREALPLLTDDQIINFAKNHGCQQPEITKIKRELKNR